MPSSLIIASIVTYGWTAQKIYDITTTPTTKNQYTQTTSSSLKTRDFKQQTKEKQN